MRHLMLLLFLALHFSAISLPAEPVPFADAVVIGKGNFLVFGDLDDDKNLDIITNYAVWYRNRGGSPPVFTSHTLINQFWRAILPIDIDKDGDLDLFVADSDYVSFLENNGDTPPAFTKHDIYYPIHYADSLCAGDLNGDGRQDLVQSQTTSIGFGLSLLGWLENKGGTPSQFEPHGGLGHETYYYNPVTADLDQDGDVDVLESESNSINSDDQGAFYFRNNGANPPAFTRHPISAIPGPVKTADLNGDGLLDVVVGIAWCKNGGGNPTTFSTALYAPNLIGPGNTFYASEMDIGDINLDHKPDLVTYSPEYNKRLDLWWYENDGQLDPAFTGRQIYHASDRLASPLLADIDSDGDLDVFFTVNGDIYMLRNLLINITAASSDHWPAYR